MTTAILVSEVDTRKSRMMASVCRTFTRKWALAFEEKKHLAFTVNPHAQSMNSCTYTSRHKNIAVGQRKSALDDVETSLAQQDTPSIALTSKFVPYKGKLCPRNYSHLSARIGASTVTDDGGRSQKYAVHGFTMEDNYYHDPNGRQEGAT